VATLAGVNGGGTSAESKHVEQKLNAADFVHTTLSSGEPAIVDASGVAVPLNHFERIASASTVADGLLLEFAEPDRVLAFTHYNMTQGWQKQRFAKPHSIDHLDDVEGLLALHPDLVLASLHGSEQVVQRLREAGIVVFNLGEMRGVDAFLRIARVVAALCGRPEEGAQYAQRFLRTLQAVAPKIADAQRKSAVYVSLYGDKLYGAGANTNYADILKYAGLFDKGAAHYEGFPEYGAEDLLSMDPQFLITRTGGAAVLCTHAGLSGLQACKDPQHDIIELPEAVISSAGAEMLIAAEWVHEGVYGSSTSDD